MFCEPYQSCFSYFIQYSKHSLFSSYHRYLDADSKANLEVNICFKNHSWFMFMLNLQAILSAVSETSGKEDIDVDQGWLVFKVQSKYSRGGRCPLI